MPPINVINYKSARQKCIHEFERLKLESYSRDARVPYRRGILLLKGELAARGLAMVDAVHELKRLLPLTFEAELLTILSDVLVVKASAESFEKMLNNSENVPKYTAKERANLLQQQAVTYARDVEILQTRIAALRFTLKTKKYDNQVYIALNIVGYSLLTLMAIGLVIGGFATCILAVGTSLVPLEAYFGGLVCILAGMLFTLLAGEQSILNYRFFSGQQFKAIDEYVHLVDSVQSSFVKPTTPSPRTAGGFNSMFYSNNGNVSDRFEEVDADGRPVPEESSCLYN